MSILAGYVREKGRLSTDLISDKIKTFSCITDDKLDQYKYHVIPTKFGHVIVRYKNDYPIKYEPVEDPAGNVLAVLGFFCLSNISKNLKNIFEECKEDSPKIIENTEGEFISVFVESPSGKVHLINDRFASRPLYILKTSTSYYFSSNLAFLFSLASHKFSIDITGLLEMFCYGHTIGEKTIFSDIQRLKPASHIVLEPNKLKVKNYWILENISDEKFNPKEYAFSVFDSFKKGVEYRANLVEKGVIALSGGLDSRLLAYCLPDKNNYTAFTFIDSIIDSETIEVNTAREVSHKLGIKHRVDFIPVASTSSLAKDIIFLTGGLRSLTHFLKIMSYIDHIKKYGRNYLLGGGPGDVLAGSKIPKSLITVSTENVDEGIRLFFKSYTSNYNMQSYLENVFKKDIIEENFSSIVKSFFDSIENLKGKTAAHKITSWALLNRWPAFTFTTPIHDHPDITESFCHLDYKFCELMLRIKAEWLYGKNFYDYMIYENLVELREIINSNTGKKLSGEITNYQWIPPSDLNVFKTKLKTKLKKLYAKVKFPASTKYFNRPYSPPQIVKSLPHSFLYTIFKEDKQLFIDLQEMLHTIPDLGNILDINQSNNFIKKFKNGELVTNSFNMDTDLLGKLSALCYSYKYLNY